MVAASRTQNPEMVSPMSLAGARCSMFSGQTNSNAPAEMMAMISVGAKDQPHAEHHQHIGRPRDAGGLRNLATTLARTDRRWRTT